MSSNSLPSSDNRPLSSCPGCSAELCKHLVCRVCGSCPECDSAEDAVLIDCGTGVPVIEFNEKLAIAPEDMPDICRALDELRAVRCICGMPKSPYLFFCGECHNLLPASFRSDLNLHLKCGYLPIIRRAWQILAKVRVTGQQ